ncbi:hypothetical protein RvY_07414 [Ramazzottius varieornatus]|uniref:Uncharacterized protein n=1 Tax=Ramazzottius varieornatus TaxID=947166 RepID=A0A1D1V866_RAMVA|nr:hypothetical protein RvY_07414 [Ramazzottius varieornatus]
MDRCLYPFSRKNEKVKALISTNPKEAFINNGRVPESDRGFSNNAAVPAAGQPNTGVLRFSAIPYREMAVVGQANNKRE